MFHQRTSHQPSFSSPARVLTLADYGWDTERERSFTPSRADELVPGRVVRAERGLCDVVAETGLVRAVVVPPAGTGDRPTPCTGDRVAVRPATAASFATVVEVLVTSAATGEGLGQAFAEIAGLARDCRFADCAHAIEPGCAVLSAIEDRHLTWRCLDSYHRLRRENAHAVSRTDVRLRAGLERTRKHGARLRRAIKQSPNFKA